MGSSRVELIIKEGDQLSFDEAVQIKVEQSFESIKML